MLWTVGAVYLHSERVGYDTGATEGSYGDDRSIRLRRWREAEYRKQLPRASVSHQQVGVVYVALSALKCSHIYVK